VLEAFRVVIRFIEVECLWRPPKPPKSWKINTRQWKISEYTGDFKASGFEVDHGVLEAFRVVIRFIQVQGLGVRVQGLGFRVLDLGVEVQDLGFRV
jgi:hypothetical protein